MIQSLFQAQGSEDDRRPKWFNSPVKFYKGTLSDIRECIPAFERRPFGLPKTEGEKMRVNERLNTIVRLPFGRDDAVIPVGVVSKEYALVPHTAVLDEAIKALDAAKIATSDVIAELRITEYGERMALSLYLPDKYKFDPGDGNPMALRLECFNSVDGSTRFRALMGWFRFVCSNGLTIGVTQFDMCRRHVGNVQIQDIKKVLTSGINQAEGEKRNFEKWRKMPVTFKRLDEWCEDILRKQWGFKAATRAFYIAKTGADVEIIGQYKGRTPTTIAVKQLKPVPGAPKESCSLFDVSQILAWLAKERRDVQEQMEWREHIPTLLRPLMN